MKNNKAADISTIQHSVLLSKFMSIEIEWTLSGEKTSEVLSISNHLRQSTKKVVKNALA